jgi:hypothetical protein
VDVKFERADAEAEPNLNPMAWVSKLAKTVFKDPFAIERI